MFINNVIIRIKELASIEVKTLMRLLIIIMRTFLQGSLFRLCILRLWAEPTTTGPLIKEVSCI